MTPTVRPETKWQWQLLSYCDACGKPNKVCMAIAPCGHRVRLCELCVRKFMAAFVGTRVRK